MAQLWGNNTTPAVPCNAVGTDGRPLLHDTMRPIGVRHTGGAALPPATSSWLPAACVCLPLSGGPTPDALPAA